MKYILVPQHLYQKSGLKQIIKDIAHVNDLKMLEQLESEYDEVNIFTTEDNLDSCYFLCNSDQSRELINLGARENQILVVSDRLQDPVKVYRSMEDYSLTDKMNSVIERVLSSD